MVGRIERPTFNGRIRTSLIISATTKLDHVCICRLQGTSGENQKGNKRIGKRGRDSSSSSRRKKRRGSTRKGVPEISLPLYTAFQHSEVSNGWASSNCDNMANEYLAVEHSFSPFPPLPFDEQLHCLWVP